MKSLKLKLAIALFVLLFATSLSAEDVLFMGKKYRNARLTALAPGSKVVLDSQGGKFTIAWANLSRGFRAENQEAYEQMHKAARGDGSIDVLYKERAEMVKKALAEFRGANAKKFIAQRLKTLLEVQTDPRTFRGQIICFQGLLEVTSWYNAGYEKARDSHVAFYMLSGTADAYLYMTRAKGEELKARILAGGPSEVSCLVEIPMESDGSERRRIAAELLDVRAVEAEGEKK